MMPVVAARGFGFMDLGPHGVPMVVLPFALQPQLSSTINKFTMTGGDSIDPSAVPVHSCIRIC